MGALLELLYYALQLIWSLPNWVLDNDPPPFVKALVWIWRLLFLGLFSVVFWAVFAEF